MALPLMTQELADVQLDVTLALRDCEERVNRAVACGEMSVQTGREVMAFLARVIELTAQSKALCDELHDVERLIDMAKRGGLRKPGDRVRRHLAHMGLQVAGRESKVVELYPNDQPAA